MLSSNGNIRDNVVMRMPPGDYWKCCQKALPLLATMGAVATTVAPHGGPESSQSHPAPRLSHVRGRHRSSYSTADKPFNVTQTAMVYFRNLGNWTPSSFKFFFIFYYFLFNIQSVTPTMFLLIPRQRNDR